MWRTPIVLAVLAAMTPALGRASLSGYLAVDQTLGPVSDAQSAFASAAGRVGDCPKVARDGPGHVRCLLAALDDVRPDGDGKLSTLLLERRGDPFSVTAALLLLHGESAQIEAVVFPPHVLIRARGDRSWYFDPMNGGREMTVGLAFSIYGLPFSRAEEADVDRFLGHYAGRHAVSASSEPLFRLALKAAPASGRLRYDYGAWLLRQNRLDDARRQLSKATQLGPDLFDAWIDRGTALEKTGRLKPARKCYVQALRVDPRSTVAAEKLRAIDARIDAAARQEEP